MFVNNVCENHVILISNLKVKVLIKCKCLFLNLREKQRDILRIKYFANKERQNFMYLLFNFRHISEQIC